MNRKEFDKIVKDNSMNLNTKINILQMYYYLRRRMNVVYYSEAEDAGTESRPFYESLNTISENLEISEDTATEHLKLLEKTGLVKKYYTGTYTTLSGQTKNAPNVFIYGYEKNPDTIAERTLTKLREQYYVNNFTFQKTIEDTDVIADTVIGKESVNEESNSTKQDTMIDKKEEDITDENFSLSDDDLPESLKLTRLDKERQSKIALIEEQREKVLQALSEQIQAMEDYKTAWTDTVNAYTKGQDEMTAAALLGSNWREDIANKDIGVLNTFSANYQGALSQLHDVIEPQITQAEAVVTAYDNEITKQNELKAQQEKYLDFYKTYSDDFAKATDQQREAVEKLNKAIQSNSESGLLSSLLQSAENSFNGDSNSLIDRLAENYNKNPSFYESILGGAKSLIGTASKNLADSITEMGKNILQNVKNDNRTSNVSNNWTFNNPVFDDSKNYEQFKAFANRFIGELNQEAQIGKK